MASFQSYNFENDPNFIEFKNKSSISSPEPESVVELKLRQRYFKRYIDPAYDPNSTNSASSTPSSSASSSSGSRSGPSSESGSNSSTSSRPSSRSQPSAPNMDWREFVTGMLTSGEGAWLMLTITLIFNALLYMFPFLGWNDVNYYRALYSAMFIYAYSLFKQTNIRLTRENLPRLVTEENFEFLMLCFAFSFTHAHLLLIMPILIYSLLGLSFWIKKNSPILPWLRYVLFYVETYIIQKYDQLMVWAAYAEFMLLPSLFFLIFTASGSFFSLICYSQFFKRRYRRSRYFQLVLQGIRQQSDSIFYNYLPNIVRAPYDNFKVLLSKYLL